MKENRDTNYCSLVFDDLGNDISSEKRIRSVLAGSSGNLIEWYDFYIYAFTSLYFSEKFFPNDDPLVQLFATSAIFALGFFLRPLGGWYFGRLADRKGRSHAIVISVLMMGVGSILIGILPTYDQIGIAAPALLLIGRMIQGFSTGGQYGTVATYLSEVAIAGRRGFFASFQYVTLVGGQLLAAGVVLILQMTLSEQQMQDFGWRIAFLIGGLGAGLILLLRNHMHEPAPSEGRHERAGHMGELRHHIPALLCVFGLTAGGSVMFYTFTTYMQKLLVLSAGMNKAVATTVVMSALIPFMFVQPLFGALADRIGRRNNLIIFGLLSVVATVPLLNGLAGTSDPVIATGLVLTGLLVAAFYTSISGLFKAELFPVHIRALAVGLSYGIANALFGGTTETVALAFKQWSMDGAFYWYVAAICAVSLCTSLMMPDARRHSLLNEREH